jgi:hypothetical protein
VDKVESILFGFLFDSFLFRILGGSLKLTAIQLDSALLQTFQMGLDVLLEFTCTLIINSLGLVVQSAVLEYSFDIITETFPIFVLIVGELLFNSFYISRVLDYQSVVGDILD